MSEIKCYSGRLFNISGWLIKESIIDYLNVFYDSDANIEYEKGNINSFYSDKYMIIHRDDYDMYALFSIDKKEEDPEFNCIIRQTGTFGEYNFLTTYYNGGTYLQEMIQNEFNNIFK